MGNVKERAEKHAAHGVTGFELTAGIVKNLKQFNLTPTAKLVLVLLTTHYNEEKNGAVVFPSMPYIAETLGIGLTATKQAIKDLINEGLIIKSKRDKVSGNYNKYLLTLKVQNTTSKRSQNELSKQSETDLFMRTNKIEKITNKTAVEKNDEYLLAYAESKGATNKVAYMNALKKNGSAESIILKHKEKLAADRFAAKRIKETQEMNAQYREWIGDDPRQCEAWINLKKIFQQ